MKIGIDAGALCGINSGNKIFTINLIKAINTKDKKNKYILYSFCTRKNNLKLNRNFIYKNLQPKYFWVDGALKFEQTTNQTDIFLGLNQAFPKSNSKKIVFSHGLSFLYYQKLYSNNFNRLNNQLLKMLKHAELIVVSSIKVKNEFKRLYPEARNIKVLNFGIPYDFLATKSVKKNKYFLNVGVNHPIKNLALLVKYFKTFQNQIDKTYKLYIVTDKKYNDIKDKNVIQLTNVSRKRLKRLYMYAKAYLTTSFYESFNLPILESLSQNTPVVALKGSFIPEMRRYISIARDESSFVCEMKEILVTNRNTDLKRLKNDFSWNKYVDELIKMY